MSRKDDKQLSIRELKELLVCYDGGNLEYLSEHRAAQILNVSRRTLKTLLENRELIEGRRVDDADGPRVVVGGPAAKRPPRHGGRRERLLDDVETGLTRRFRETADSNRWPADDAYLLDAARDIAARLGVADFVPTVTWLMHWKYKNNIPLEPAAAPVPRSDVPDVSATKKWLDDLLKYAAANYRADDVYGLVETGLYRPTADAVECAGGGRRQLVHRASVIFLCNVTGTEKKQPLVIDCNDRGDLRPNALMTSYYTSSLLKWDREMGSRKVLLVLDNRSVHPKLRLRNIDVKYLPSRFTHPLGQNIVRIAKSYEQCRNALPPPPPQYEPTAHASSVPSWEHTTSEYLNMLFAAWADVSAQLIRDCFRTIGFATTGENHVQPTALTDPRDPNGDRKRPRISSKVSRPEVDGPQMKRDENPNVPLDLTKTTATAFPQRPVMYGCSGAAVDHRFLRTC